MIDGNRHAIALDELFLEGLHLGSAKYGMLIPGLSCNWYRASRGAPVFVAVALESSIKKDAPLVDMIYVTNDFFVFTYDRATMVVVHESASTLAFQESIQYRLDESQLWSEQLC